MKIGIVTYHRTLNYGAVMQTLATRFVLQEMGHDVYYVDYWPDYHKKLYDYFSFRLFIKHCLKLKIYSYLRLCIWGKRRYENFDLFFKKFVYPYCLPIEDSYDVVIYGSDQIWRKQKALGTYNQFYFGVNNIKTNRHISYAASMGILPDNDIDKEKVKTLVSHLEKVSVREEGLRQLLLSLGIENVSLSLDPTLLLDSNEWDKHLPTETYHGEKYVLVYIMGSNPFDLKEIKKFADSKGLKTLILLGNAKTKETETNITSASPYDFIRLIKNADYVFSASFHGLAFSIIYEKLFFTSFNINAGRAESLLEQLGIKGRLLPPNTSIPEDIGPIDYPEVRRKLELLKENSIKYLYDIK